MALLAQQSRADLDGQLSSGMQPVQVRGQTGDGRGFGALHVDLDDAGVREFVAREQGGKRLGVGFEHRVGRAAGGVEGEAAGPVGDRRLDGADVADLARDQRLGEDVVEVRGGFDRDDVAGGAGGAGGAGEVGGQEGEVADVRADVEERVAGPDPGGDPVGEVRFPAAEQVEVALDEVGGGARG